jgi:PHD/YefM family antitoxin component YafN of YafNO toxin-antitoxin module
MNGPLRAAPDVAARPDISVPAVRLNPAGAGAGGSPQREIARFLDQLPNALRIWNSRQEVTMREATATEIAKNFRRYRDIAQREPVAVKSQGQASTYLVSAAEFEEWQRYKQLARQSFATRDLSSEHIDAIAQGRMSPEHDHRNALLDPA